VADQESLLRPGDTCWRTASADRAALLVDNAAYFRALRAALLKAERSILFLGWQFDPRTVLEPGPEGEPQTPDGRLGDLLLRLSQERPDLEIRILVWRMDLPIAASQGFYPQRAAGWFKDSRIAFQMDRSHPLGACHHQKIVVIDEALAFTGGGDVSVDRWDTPEHPFEDHRRRMPNGKLHPPRHEVMLCLSGPIVRVLADHVRRRWAGAFDEELEPRPSSGSDPWPDHVAPLFNDVRIGVARTEPAWDGDPGVLEIERLHLAGLAAARRCIVLENQYVASPVVETLLARRLQEPDGPEVVVITTKKSPSWFDQMTMDRTRAAMVGRLRAADVYGRFRAYCPVTAGGKGVIVHSKVSIIDDRMLRVGSANLNNRSFGFDTEIDCALEAETDAQRQAVRAFRTELISHWLGVDPHAFEREDELGGPGIVEALDRLSERTGRLVPVERYKQGPLRNLIALHHLGDPVEPTDSWQPWLRTGKLLRRTRRLLGPSRGAR
jgi:phosphatidylserine/phosphatidylglycerophosphate/cardiolipin synthase-like enzyme